MGTTGDCRRPKLDAPPNARLVEFADHEQLMALASFVIGHGGHGTAMRTLRHGIPLLVFRLWVDQVVVTETIDGGAPDVRLAPIRQWRHICAAAQEVLGNGRSRREAESLGEQLQNIDGAALAADSVSRCSDRRRLGQFTRGGAVGLAVLR